MKFFLFFLSLIFAQQIFAKDFSYNGIVFSILDEEEKTCQTKEGSFAEPGNDVSGELALDEIVYDGTTPYTLKLIAPYSFTWCDNLTKVNLPNSVEKIGEHAFSRCSNLVNIIFPNSLSRINNNAFESCSKLESISLSNGIEFIGDYAFNQCKNIKSINLGSSLEYIGEHAFEYCSSLSNIELPESLISIGKNGFTHSGLTSIILPCSLSEIPSSSFSGCSRLAYVKIPNSVEKIGEKAFSLCRQLETIEFPSSVKEIGEDCFHSSGLTNITITSTMERVGCSAFSYCSNLSSVTFLDSSAIIEDWAFTECGSLMNVYSFAEKPLKCYSNTFARSNIPSCQLHVPLGCRGKYATATGWSIFHNIIADIDLSSVDQIDFDIDNPLSVYNINGTKISITDMDKLNNLPSGIYIINGKKWIK